jgi:beta-lactamase regulating signal transducer with metallopeptidase domain
MNAVFLRVLNMSAAASCVILFVMAARLLLKKAPKIFSYALWGVVLFRLICPFSFEGAFSLLPINPEPIPGGIVYMDAPRLNTGIDLIDRVASPLLPAAVQSGGADALQAWVGAGGMIWITGAAALLAYGAVSLLRLRLKLVGAVKWRDNIYLADHIASPFVIGLLSPKIYLPSDLSWEGREYIILHEQGHISRRDHIAKVAAFLALAAHWFNPLVWAAFFLCMEDMEMSCDEGVMKRMDRDVRCEYSALLLSFATDRKIGAGIPLAFGEGGVKARIKNVLNYKRPSLWIVVAAVVLCISLSVCLIANPRTNPSESQPEHENQEGVVSDDDRAAQQTVRSFFAAFENSDYESMRQYCTQECIDANFNTDDVMGLKWAKATAVESSFADVTGRDGEIAVFVSIEMEVVSLRHALYGSDRTAFYAILLKDGGNWLIDRFATG